jgi:glycosyltransferase involved in cell wall biosynthesis
MRIVMDMQGAQTESRFRGIGRYTLSLALSIARNAGDHEIYLVLNAAFPERILDIRHAFEGLIPQERIRVFGVPAPVAEHVPDNAWRARAAEKIREYFIEQLRPDVVLLSSLFEGYIDDAVTAVGTFSAANNTAVILYDLIPFLNPAAYLPTLTQRHYYHRKIQSLKRAGLLLAISDYSRLEAIEVLGFDQNRVVNISAAVDPRFKPQNLPPEDAEALRQRFGIKRKMVMYAPGGFDVRKNFDGLINAYALIPSELRASHQLVIVSKISDIDRANLQQLRKQAKLATDELVLTDYVSDDDLVALYNLATLFVFPSTHEGFGLPALEAMTCGAPTIGSSTTSIPEVLGWDKALFDPASVRSMTNKLAQALTDDEFRGQLRGHGFQQVQQFSWDASAKSVIAAFEVLQSKKQQEKAFIKASARRPKLAYISPLPPERSGISDYSAELLPELARYYAIEVVVSQQTVLEPWINANCPIRSVEWFQQNASNYDRVLYQFGNSPFHSHMFGLLRQHPGVVMLHDFFLSGVLAHEEMTGDRPGAWVDALYHSHGYQAVQMRFTENEIDNVKDKYPANLEVLQNALGMIVHSQYSRYLGTQWYGGEASGNWRVIPLLRISVLKVDKLAGRRALNLQEDDFVVCSFGMLAPTKLNQRLLDAWLASSLSKNERCKLVFVGENHGGDYGAELLKTIKESGLEKRICITGWADTTSFHHYLAVADIGVQLRTLSRGETSAAVLDCMNYGLPTIVNANGSMAELPRDAVWMLPDAFSDTELVDALETLWQDSERRKQLASRAREVILTQHDPGACANQYAQAIESMYQRAATGQHALVKAIAALDNLPSDNSALKRVAKSVAASFSPEPSPRQLLIDVSCIVRHDLKSGIERVVRAQLLELIKEPPGGFRIEPVYLTGQGGQWHYRYARSYTCKMLGIEQASLCDAPIDISQGDVFYGLDFCPDSVINAARSGIYLKWKAAGLSINFLVYDLLPVLRSEFFPGGVAITHATWLKTIAEFSSRLICISNAVANELRLWLENNPPARKGQLLIDAVHLGADIIASAPSTGLPDNAEKVLKAVSATPAFIMVATLEPRKGHLQTLAAFELLWEQGQQINLVLVGKEGWKPLPNSQRRTIPRIVEKLRKHKESGKRLFWLEGISDEYLDQIYAASTCLIAASEGEGFGLPLIEAAQHQLPIIARDIPVFREVAGEHACYFSGLEPNAIAVAVKSWLALNAEGRAPQSVAIPRFTWKQCAANLLDTLGVTGR